MPSGVVSVGVLADFAQLIEQSDAAGLSIEAFSGKVVTSSRQASRAMADFMKQNGASADEAKAAAAQTAAAWDATYGQLSKGARDAGQAALATSRLFKESADQQTAAFAQTAAASRDLEMQQKAAADAAQAAAAKTAAAAEASAKRVVAAQKKLAATGKWALFGGVAAVAASVKGASDLQTSMERLHTQAGVSQAAIKGLTGSVMSMSGALATAPNQLAQSLYHVESGGVHGAAALKVMATAAKEAKVSGADLVDTTTALTATVYSGISGATDYAKAMGLLNATVGAGDMTFQNLNDALGGPMLATVKGYGLSLKDVGAALATFGDLNIRGADAATQLRMAVQYMARPAVTAGPILQKLGLSTTSFADAMSKGGLLPALQLLHDKLVQAQIPAKDYAQVISDIFSKKGASGVTILENSLTKLESKYKEVGKGANQVNQGWIGWNKTLAADVDHLKATVQSLADKFGTVLLPALTKTAHTVQDVIGWFEKHKAAAEALGAVIAGVLGAAVTVFATTKAMQFVGALRGMGDGVMKLIGILPGLGTTATATAGEVDAAGATMVAGADTTAAGVDAALGSTGIGLVVIGLGVAAAELATHWSTAMHAVESVTQAVINDVVLPMLNQVISMINTASSALNTLTFGAVAGGQIGKLGNVNLTGPSTATQLFNAANQRTNQGAHNEANLLGLANGDVWQSMGKNFHNRWGGHEIQVSATAVERAAKANHMSLREYAKKTGINWGQLQGALRTPIASDTATSTTGAQLVSYFQHTLGLTRAQAAGIAGNLQEESAGTFAGNIVQGGSRSSTIVPGTGYGLAQWTSTGRQQGLADLARQMGLSQDSVKVQEAYIVQELKGSYASALKNLRGTSTAAQAATVIQNEYEGPASLTASLAQRQAYATALAGGKNPAGSPGTGGGSSSILTTIQNLGSGSKLPTVMQYEAEKSRATQLQDKATRAQAVGQAQVTVLQAINQQLQDKGTAVVQHLANLQQMRNDVGSAGAMRRLSDMLFGSGLQTTGKWAETVAAPGVHGSTSIRSLEGMQRIIARGGGGAAEITALKDLQTIIDQKSAMQTAAIKDQTTVMQDRSAVQVAAIQGSAQIIADALSAQATQITDSAQTNADFISERGLYGLNLVTQQLRVQADQVKAYWDKQIANAQQSLDRDQQRANIANAQSQLLTDQVTAAQNMKVLQAQQNVNLVTLKENALEAKAQQHLDAVTMKQDGLANAAKAHMDAVTISQDSRILRATQHADAVQLSVDTTKIGPAQIAVDMSANKDKTTQQIMAAQLKLATAQGDVQINAAQLELAKVTSSANQAIAGAQNAYQSVQNTANLAIQSAQNQNAAVQNAGNLAIQAATDTFQQVQDAANQAIASAQQAQASTAAQWAAQIASDQAALSGTQGNAATAEAGAGAAVTNMQALASTQFAGSGLTVNMYGIDMSNAGMVANEASWAIRSSGLATV